MSEDLTTYLLGLLKVLSNIETVTFRKEQKAVNPARMLANMLVEHSSKAVAAKVRRDYANVLEPVSAPVIGATPAPKLAPRTYRDSAKVLVKATDKPIDVERKMGSSRRTRTKVAVKPEPACTIVLGPHGTEAQAKAEALQLLHPMAIQYRQAYFAPPANFGVTVKVTSAVPVKLAKPTNPLNPWGVRICLDVTGEPAKVEGWIQAFRNRARMWVVV
jgi:hypothetical protein